jgi:CheY-like chemotaxis protein
MNQDSKKHFSILVAEDDDGHFILIKKNLEKMGFQSRILRFPNGQDILDFLYMQGEGPKRDPDDNYLMILDIRMPKVDGDKVLEIVKADDQLKDIPVIMLTTSSDERQMKKCQNLGCKAYIVKPMRFSDFEGAIQQVGSSLLLSVLKMSGVNPSENQ